MAEPAPTVSPATLSAGGRRWRAGVTVAALAVLGYGTVAGHDQLFPFGPMSQYARWVPPDGTVDSTSVWADTTAGAHVEVALTSTGVGVKRADIEGRLGAIEAHPDLLRAISSAQRRLHPDEPQFTKIYVVVETIHLHDRVPANTTQRTLVSWDVAP